MIYKFNFLAKRKLYIIFLLQFILILNSIELAEAEVSKSPTIISSGILDGEKGPINLISKDHKGKKKIQYKKINEYRVSANVSFKTQKQEQILNELKLYLYDGLKIIDDNTKINFKVTDNQKENSKKYKFLLKSQIFDRYKHDIRSKNLSSNDERYYWTYNGFFECQVEESSEY